MPLAPRREDELRAEVAEPPAPAAQPELPDELDARVRLVGEWQLGEA
jgi:hypothetical protein